MPSVLYVGDLGRGLTSQDRRDALIGLGASVESVTVPPYRGILRKIDWVLSSRVQMSPGIAQLNREIRERFARRPYDILWLDKGWLIQPRTLRSIRAKVSTIVILNNDNPWGGHERGMWRLHKGIIPLVDEILTPRYSVVRSYERRGARRVSVVDFGFAPERQFRPDRPTVKEHDICFIGSALKDGDGIRPPRTRFLLDLAKRLPGLISVFGPGWEKALKGSEHNFKVVADGVWDDQYRETIWKSKVNLAFITRDNWDETSHRAYEITACGGCLLSERSSRLEQIFTAGQEAMFFSDAAQCADLARWLLNDDQLRQRISGAGHARVLADGCDNHSRLGEAIARSPVLSRHFPGLVWKPGCFPAEDAHAV